MDDHCDFLQIWSLKNLQKCKFEGCKKIKMEIYSLNETVPLSGMTLATVRRKERQKKKS